MYSTAFMGLMGGGGVYRAKAVNFDGSTYLSKTSDFTGNANAKTMLFSLCFKRTKSATMELLSARNPLTGGNIAIQVISGGTMNMTLTDTSNSAVVVASISGAFSGNSWVQLSGYIDVTNSSNRGMYLGDSAATVTWTNYSNTNIDFTQSNGYNFGADGGNSGKITGDIADVYFAFGQYLDLSVTNNRRKFVDVNGKPADLGDGGLNPTGVAPILYLSRRNDTASSFATNKGTGGGMTITGTLTNSTTSPSD